MMDVVSSPELLHVYFWYISSDLKCFEEGSEFESIQYHLKSRVYEDEMKRSTSSTSNSQNLAFLFSENTSSNNEVSTASRYFGVSTAGRTSSSSQVSSTPCADEVMCSFLQQTTIPQLKNEDLQQIDQDDLEELDIRWQVAMLTVRSKVECYNCHMTRHFARECKSRRNQEKRSYGDNGRRNAPTNEPSSQALVAQDGLGGYDWSNDVDEPVNYALMAISSTNSLSSSNNEVRLSDEEITPTNDRFSKADRYHAVPPPITGNFLTLRDDISFTSLDEYAIRKKIIESKTTKLKNDTSESKTSETVGKTNEVRVEIPKSVDESVVSKPKINKDKVIIEDWNSDDEDDVSEVKTVSPVKTNETQTVKTQVDQISQISQKEGIGFKKIKSCFVCKSTDHLIKDCDFYDKKSPEPKLKTGKSKGFSKLMGKEVNSRAFKHNGEVISVKPVGTARVKNMTTAGTRAVVSTDNALKKPRDLQVSGGLVVDSGCSSHMTGNKTYLSDYEDYNGGFVAFGSDPKGGKITGKGKIRTANLDFDDVYFVDELNFKLLDESQVVLRASKQNDVYNLDLENIVPSRVKIIRSDHGKEFKNHAMNEFCAKKGIKRELSVARTP
ncbi:ribonuclease H-like domain-containing protein [Tanacetum coccineum]